MPSSTSGGSRGPRPYTQRRLSTFFLRVPAIDWVPVTHGVKSEFRAAPNQVPQALLRDTIELPTPVVAYRVSTEGGHAHRLIHAHRLMVLEETWVEPLGAISEEGLRREGFESVAHFRRYWMARSRRRFRPLQKVRVFRVRLIVPGDWEAFAEVFMDRLYGEFK